jgi:hypothetical protein
MAVKIEGDEIAVRGEKKAKSACLCIGRMVGETETHPSPVASAVCAKIDKKSTVDEPFVSHF